MGGRGIKAVLSEACWLVGFLALASRGALRTTSPAEDRNCTP